MIKLLRRWFHRHVRMRHLMRPLEKMMRYILVHHKPHKAMKQIEILERRVRREDRALCDTCRQRAYVVLSRQAYFLNNHSILEKRGSAGVPYTESFSTNKENELDWVAQRFLDRFYRVFATEAENFVDSRWDKAADAISLEELANDFDELAAKERPPEKEADTKLRHLLRKTQGEKKKAEGESDDDNGGGD